MWSELDHERVIDHGAAECDAARGRDTSTKMKISCVMISHGISTMLIVSYVMIGHAMIGHAMIGCGMVCCDMVCCGMMCWDMVSMVIVTLLTIDCDAARSVGAGAAPAGPAARPGGPT
jgi:hypothetical protein